MGKREFRDHYPTPFATPKQLENSRKAIRDFLIATRAANEKTVEKNPRIRDVNEKIRVAREKLER